MAKRQFEQLLLNYSLFQPTETPKDSKGLPIKDGKTLFRHVFEDNAAVMKVEYRLTSDEKIALLKVYIDSLRYDLDVALAGLKRERKEKERISQERLFN